MHTQKCLAICEPNQKIVYLSSSLSEGKIHDNVIWNEENIDIQEEIILLADLGFLGIEKHYPSALLPFTKPKEEFTKPKKEINRKISSMRVTIEHTFASVKRLKIVRNKIRLKMWQVRESVMEIAVAFHKKRIKYRTMYKQT